MSERITALWVLAMALTLAAIWAFAWVLPNDRRLREIEECMGGDSQRFHHCAEEADR